jgi:hypothetical protein
MVGPLGGVGGKVRQWPPPKLKTSIAGPLVCGWQGLVATTTKVEEVDGGPPGGCWRQGLAAVTTNVEDVDGGPP